MSTRMPFTDIMSSGSSGNPAFEELSGTSVFLTRAHIPFRVISNEAEDFDGLNTIVMNNILYTTKKENDRIRRFVKDGGTLIATGMTSLYEPDGATTGDFGLADVFGVSYAGEKAKRFHYLSFTDRPLADFILCSGAACKGEKSQAARKHS